MPTSGIDGNVGRLPRERVERLWWRAFLERGPSPIAFSDPDNMSAGIAVGAAPNATDDRASSVLGVPTYWQ